MLNYFYCSLTQFSLHSLADFETSTFLSRKITLNTLIHSSLHRSRSFPSAPTLTAKVSNIPDTAKLFAMFFVPKDKKWHWTLPLPREKYFHISIPWQQFNALFLYTIPYEKVNNLLRLSLCYRSLSRIHREITKRWHHLIHAILGTHQLCRHSHKADTAILLLYGVLSKRSIHNNMVLGVLNLTIPIINEIIIFFIPYYILKGLYFIFLVPRIILPSLPDYECKSKKIISISQISKPTLYEMPDWMYQMTKRISASTSK